MSYTVINKPITPHEIIDFQAAKIHKKITPKQKKTKKLYNFFPQAFPEVMFAYSVLF